MIRLKMIFCFDNKHEVLELTKTQFYHPLHSEPLCCVRGKTTGAHQGSAHSFQWTKAVRALSLLFASTAYSFQAEGKGRNFTTLLTGYQGSLAASLDYALSKQPHWLCDMFGVTKDGDSVARRLILRSNPECKRPGPVSVSLNNRFICPSQIVICDDLGELFDVEQLRILVKQLFKDGMESSLPIRGLIAAA